MSGFYSEEHIAPFGIMKTRHQRGSFLVSTSLDSPCPMTELHGIFCYRVLSSLVSNNDQCQKLVLTMGSPGYL